MTREEFNAVCADLLGVESPETAKISDGVTRLKEAFSNLYTENELAEAEVTSLKTQVADLKDQNIKLFLKVTAAPEEVQPQQKQKRSFEDLFDTNGKLK